jgi:hypothetical protein
MKKVAFVGGFVSDLAVFGLAPERYHAAKLSIATGLRRATAFCIGREDGSLAWPAKHWYYAYQCFAGCNARMFAMWLLDRPHP